MSVNTVRAYYDDGVPYEWSRLEERCIPEFHITKRYLERYIHAGDRVLDMGGGPGRYALWLAERGCEVTLADLSPNNAAFAAEEAARRGLPLRTFCADARTPDMLADELFDHVLLMGPLYHLTEEIDRLQAVRANLALLHPGGTFFAAFINSYAGVWDYCAKYPELILNSDTHCFFELLTEDKPFCGNSFTEFCFIRPTDIAPFMAQFPLIQQHLVNCEAFLALRKKEFSTLPQEIQIAWLEVAEKVCEREDLLSMAEHFLYIGIKEDIK